MSKTIFDLVHDLTINKIEWSDQSDADKKQFTSYMTNRILSMGYDMIEMVNYIQQYTPTLSPEMVYKIYLDVLPKRKIFNKYIGNKSEVKHQKLVDFFTPLFQMNQREILEIIERSTPQQIKTELRRYGLNDTQIKQIYG